MITNGNKYGSRPFLNTYEDGEMPHPQPLPYMGSGFSDGAWLAMLKSGWVYKKRSG
ncbi:hypothetical protein [Fodinibius halophilus]|uniref:Uncharacterized protein n=1 Tax=Fodinibius halophilus TaxID=1736908 RepID=A0A6M1TJJ6_9BACT|nr:hypothetical protein [Fodinibius halophilus]NGP90222.1 hypothetical protein [Fodinibius halophilus]